MDLPEIVRDQLLNGVEGDRWPAYLGFDTGGVLVARGGSLTAYGLDRFQPGSLVGQMPFLKDLFPLSDSPLSLPAVEVEHGALADLQLLSHADRNYVIFLKPAITESRQPARQTDEFNGQRKPGGVHQQALSDIVTVVDALMVLHRKDGSLECFCPAPEWARQLWPGLDSEDFQFQEEDQFLKQFITEAQTLAKTDAGILHSGVWNQNASGKDVFLEATAIRGNAGQLLVIKRLSEEFEARREAIRAERSRTLLLQDRRVGERRRFDNRRAPESNGEGRATAASARVPQAEIPYRAKPGDWRKSEAQLLHAQKLEAVGRLAGGVAHDFNNLLTVILGYSDAVLSRLHADDEYRKELDEIRRAAQRAARLTRQLLAFGRRQLVRPETLDLGRTVTEIHMLLRRVIGEDIDLHVHVSPGLGSIHADGGQIGQVLMNLAVNSREAMPSGGQLRIGLSNVDVEKPLVFETAGLTAGRFVRMTVTDTGCGMDKDTRACAFEPFFTTKSGASGLGLSTAYGIVKQSGGEIRVESEPGRGTTFTIDFPRVDVPPLPLRQPVNQLLSPSGNETVLIVDDEIHVGRLVAATLQSRGYKTLVAFHPENAESLAAEHPGEIDLLLTDMVLPSCTGVDLARAIVRHRPSIRTLFMSGYTEEGPGEATAFLQKPFSSTQLAQKVREVLDYPYDNPA